jgi:VCBS repeat-containing protein
MTKRADWIKYSVGSKGNDHLQGSTAKDVIIGRQGDDWIHGGAGNDLVTGDDVSGGKLWGWMFGGCWYARGGGNDYLDGGSGSDLVLAGRGNDVANFTLQENLRSHDAYDGGKGFDTLQLSLTYGEARLGSVQKDIAAFETFLECRADPRSDHGKTFEFKSFDLDVRNFETLKIEFVNAAPSARHDAVATDEDTPLAIAPASLLANDSDPDHLDVLTVIDADALSALGAVVTIDADGNLGYDPTEALALQQLAEGVTAIDSFNYRIADLGSATATATVQVTVTGVNDAPDALDDAVTLQVGSGGGTVKHLITFEGATDPLDVDGFRFEGFYISDMFGEGNFLSYMAAAGTSNNNAGGGSDADGAVRHADGQDFSLLSLSIAAQNVEPTVTIVGYNDGAPVDGAMLTKMLNAGYAHIEFGPAWGSVDEVRFYGAVDPDQGVLVDYMQIDNLQVAVGGGGGGGEAAPIDIGVLANDTDIDRGDVLELLSFDDTSEMGAAISLNPDGTLHYDPSEADFSTLAPGEPDTFEYMVSDGKGGTDVATVSVTLLGADEPDSAFNGLLSAADVNLF